MPRTGLRGPGAESDPRQELHRYLINHYCYPIAIYSSQKRAGDTLWMEEPLQRTVGKDEPRHTPYVSVLEASLAFHSSLAITLLSEFLEHALGNTEAAKTEWRTARLCALEQPAQDAVPPPADPASADFTPTGR